MRILETRRMKLAKKRRSMVIKERSGYEREEWEQVVHG